MLEPASDLLRRTQLLNLIVTSRASDGLAATWAQLQQVLQHDGLTPGLDVGARGHGSRG